MLSNAILVLEDNLIDFLLLKELLAEFGFISANFYHCRNTSELNSAAVKAFCPTFIFVDLNLNDYPGGLPTFQLVHELFPSIPKVVFSSIRDERVALECIQAGAQTFLEKGSFAGKHLVKVIAFATERNRLKHEVEILKSEYQNIFESNPLPIFIVNSQTSKFITVNQAAVNKYGYTKEEFTTLKLSAIETDCCNSCINYKTHLTKTGETLYVEVTCSDTEYKKIPCHLITVNDVSQKVIALREERKAKQRLDAIFNGTNDAILVADDNGNYKQVNAAACKMLGYNEDELLTLYVTDIVVNVNPLKHNSSLWDSFLGKGDQSGIIELKRKDSGIIICHYNATANILPGLHLSILTDITERENARRKIEEQNRQIENILESINDCFFTVDSNWIVQYWNKAAEQIVGVPRENIIGKCIWDLYEGSSLRRAYYEYQKAIKEKVAVHFEDYYPAEQRWAEVAAYPTKDGLAVYFKDITARKNQALELLQTKNNQAALINSSKDLIWSVDKDVRLVSFNSAYKNRLENTLNLYVTEGFQLPVNADKTKKQFENWQKYYMRALKGEAFCVDEVLNEKTIAKARHVEISFNPIYDINSNEVIGVACYSRDISERKQYQQLIEEKNEQLKASEDDLRKMSSDLQKIMNSSLDVICSINKDGQFVKVSAASQKVWGYSPKELIGRRPMEFVPEEYRDMTWKAVSNIIAGSGENYFENKFIHRNGKVVSLIWSARWDEEEQTMFSVARDASALKEAEMVKVQSQTRFEALVQKGADMVGIVDENANYLFVSPNIKNIVGFDPEFLMGKNALAFIHPDDVQRVLLEFEKVLTENEVKLAAFRYQNIVGEYRWIETVATNQLNNPAIGGIVINSRDITERKKIETEREAIIKELTKSNADLKQFSFITSHNLRAPLSNLKGILNIIDYPNLNSFNLGMIELIKQSTSQLHQTIDDLTQILLIRNNVNVPVCSLNLSKVYDDVYKTFSNALSDVCGRIVTDFKVPTITFNKAYLQSILINLISNAIRYHSPERCLLINITTFEDEAGNIIFTFSDNGSGIDLRRYKDRVFGLYQRFHSAVGGQGLGLFIIKSQVTALGGKIDIDSELNKGTTFTMTFKNKIVTEDEQAEYAEEVLAEA
jgi:PAS domain S-box-containing protein